MRYKSSLKKIRINFNDKFNGKINGKINGNINSNVNGKFNENGNGNFKTTNNKPQTIKQKCIAKKKLND